MRSHLCSGMNHIQSCSCKTTIKNWSICVFLLFEASNLGAVRKHWPEALEHAWGNALASHHTDHPDAADATDGRLRHCGAAPGSLTFKHHLLSLRALWYRFLNHSVPLWTFTRLSVLMQIDLFYITIIYWYGKDAIEILSWLIQDCNLSPLVCALL